MIWVVLIGIIVYLLGFYSTCAFIHYVLGEKLKDVDTVISLFWPVSWVVILVILVIVGILWVLQWPLVWMGIIDE